MAAMYPGVMPGLVEAIHISAAESELPDPVDAVDVTADGVLGDRYGEARDLTLIEAEALEGLREDTGIELSAAECRRQVLTRGIRLNDLVGRRFRVGGIECEATRLCEPCQGLTDHIGKPVLKPLAHRAGLRALILTDGEIALGDEIVALD